MRLLFSTPLFLFAFLPLVLLLYFFSPVRLRNIILFGSSFCFFCWGEPVFTWLVLASAIFDWCLCHVMSRVKLTKWRFSLAFVGVLGNISILLYYKYTNFFFDNLNIGLGWLGANAIDVGQILLPIGVSFIVFEKVTYIVDVYKGLYKPSHSLIYYLVYVFLFPKLLAGPIVKYHEIADQLIDHKSSVNDICFGVERFIIGLAKKVFIADTMAEAVDAIFALSPSDISFGYAWLGAICFTMQIYFDFSGYSDMAIGMARVFGFRLRENFNMPYISQNFTEFWQRWHISLSTWIREYLYIPLGGNRLGMLVTYRNLLIAFLLSGIWHGANWTFIVWGIYHGMFLIGDRIFWRAFQTKVPKIMNVVSCFGFIVIGWVIFRSPDILYAGSYIAKMFGFYAGKDTFIYIADSIWFFLGVAFCLSVLPLVPWYDKFRCWLKDKVWFVYVESILIVMVAIVAFAKVATTTFNPFLYFRF